MNAEKVPSPAARKLQSGAKLSLHFRKSDEPPWSAKAVDRILHNEVYTGKLVQGKTRRLDYRSKKKMNVPIRDWTIVDNTHEAIIPAEQFELVQRILETETRRPNDAETVALFAGFLYCGDCGSRLVRRSASYKGKRYIYYQCSGSKQNKGSCTSHNLRDEKLHNIVRNALQMQIQIVMEEAEFVERIADLMGYRHTKDGQLVIEPEEAKTVRFIFLAFIQGYNYDQIATILTQKKRSTLRGRQEWNGVMVANIMKNERRWGDLEARKSIVVDYKLGKVTKNNGNRCSAYVPEHHEAIVSPEIARAAHLVASSRKKCGVQDIVVIQQGTLKGFVGIHPNWSGISVESIRCLCLSTYLPEEVAKLNDIAEMRTGTTLGKVLQSEYLTVSGTCFINQSSPVMTISKNGIRFSKACHTRLDNCEYVELLYHPILQVVILRKSDHSSSTAMHWQDDNDVHSAFSARAFSGLILQTLNWKMNCRYQCRGICRGQGNAKFLIFELDESRILIGKNQYEQIEGRSMDLKCRLYRHKWVQSITVRDVMESGQVVENPMIGAIPSRNEVQRELDDLLMSMQEDLRNGRKKQGAGNECSGDLANS